MVNLSRDYLRKNKHKKYYLSEPVVKNGENEILIEIKDSKDTPKEAVLNTELNRMIDIAVSGLPAQQRMVFILKHIQGINTPEIARILDCSRSTVKVHLFNAVRNLRKKLQRYLVIEPKKEQ